MVLVDFSNLDHGSHISLKKRTIFSVSFTFSPFYVEIIQGHAYIHNTEEVQILRIDLGVHVCVYLL